MDHVVCLDAKSMELEKLLVGEKTILVRPSEAGTSSTIPVSAGDTLYFLRKAKARVLAKATVRAAPIFQRLTPEQAHTLVTTYQQKIQFSKEQLNRWSMLGNLALIEVESVYPVEPFSIDPKCIEGAHSWLSVGSIERVKANPQ